MNIPPSYTHNFTTTSTAPLICCLYKSIYGLKQVLDSWFHKFRGTLVSFSFYQSKHEYSLFTKGNGNIFVALFVYIDDIIIVGPNMDCMHFVYHHLQNTFKLKDLNDLKLFLGIELSKSKNGIFMCQCLNILSLVEDCGMLACKSFIVHMLPNLHLHNTSNTPIDNPSI